MTRQQLAVLMGAVVTSFTIGFAAAMPGARFGGAAAEPDVYRIDLQDLDAVVAGAVDPDGVAWVVARHGDSDALRLYRISSDGSRRRTALPISSAGALAGISTGNGAVWVAAGATVARIDPKTGRATRVIELGGPTSAASAAQRAPDGTILGWGQATSVAIDLTGAAWIARYAVPALTRIDGVTFEVTDLNVGMDTDAERLTAAGTKIWFTTNFGPTQQLGAHIGVLDPATRSVQLLPVTAATVVATSTAVEAIGAIRSSIDPTTFEISGGRLPRETISLGAVAADASGNLIARAARVNRLLVFDERGRAVRTIDFEAGTFLARGRTVSMVAPLSFVAVAANGIWFAARGGNSVYRAR